jgi:hypothetical protein
MGRVVVNANGGDGVRRVEERTERIQGLQDLVNIKPMELNERRDIAC